MEDSNVVPIYFHLSYTVQSIPNNNMDGDPFDYVVDFRMSEVVGNIIRILIDEESLFVLHRINNTEEIPQYKNIATIFYILKSVDASIKSVFISKNEDDELDLRFTILIPNKSVLIINMDIVTGLALSQMFEAPISITQELFNEVCQEAEKDEDDD